MAISIGDGHLVFGSGGHLKRHPTSGHLLRRDGIRFSSPTAVKIGENSYEALNIGHAPTKADAYPALYNNRYDVSWVGGSYFEADCGWMKRIRMGPIDDVYAKVRSSFVVYDTSTLNGTSMSAVALNASKYSFAAGGGKMYVGFFTSSSATEDNTYAWITGAANKFEITASGAQTKNFASGLTFDDYLFATIWIDAYEPATAYSNYSINLIPPYTPNHYITIDHNFVFFRA